MAIKRLKIDIFQKFQKQCLSQPISYPIKLGSFDFEIFKITPQHHYMQTRLRVQLFNPYVTVCCVKESIAHVDKVRVQLFNPYATVCCVKESIAHVVALTLLLDVAICRIKLRMAGATDAVFFALSVLQHVYYLRYLKNSKRF